MSLTYCALSHARDRHKTEGQYSTNHNIGSYCYRITAIQSVARSDFRSTKRLGTRDPATGSQIKRQNPAAGRRRAVQGGTVYGVLRDR